jgi:hypothetical protein
VKLGLLAFGALSLTAQFNDFAVTDDGRLFFSTRLKHDSEAAC